MKYFSDFMRGYCVKFVVEHALCRNGKCDTSTAFIPVFLILIFLWYLSDELVKNGEKYPYLEEN